MSDFGPMESHEWRAMCEVMPDATKEEISQRRVEWWREFEEELAWDEVKRGGKKRGDPPAER